MHLPFDHEDQRAAVTELSVGTVPADEVREAGNRGAEIGACIVAVANVVQRVRADAANFPPTCEIEFVAARADAGFTNGRSSPDREEPIYAPGSRRWRDPRSDLLAGAAWSNAKTTITTALGLPADDPSHWLHEHAWVLTTRTAPSPTASVTKQ